MSTGVWTADNYCVMYFLSFCYKILCTECLDLDLFHSINIMLCWCYRKHIIIDLVHVDANRYLINPVKKQSNLNRTQPCLPYPFFLRVRKPSSSTHPYYFGWDCDLRKQVTTERASSIWVFWKTLHTEPGSGPLKPTNGSVAGTGRELRKELEIGRASCRERLMNEWMRRIVRDMNPWVLVYELLIITVLCIFCLSAVKLGVLNAWI